MDLRLPNEKGNTYLLHNLPQKMQMGVFMIESTLFGIYIIGCLVVSYLIWKEEEEFGAEEMVIPLFVLLWPLALVVAAFVLSLGKLKD
jgi:hypothetical protein